MRLALSIEIQEGMTYAQTLAMARAGEDLGLGAARIAGHPPVVGLARFSYRVLPKPNHQVEDHGHHARVRPGMVDVIWRNTDRRPCHHHAALCLATAILIVGRLMDWRNRWSPR